MGQKYSIDLTPQAEAVYVRLADEHDECIDAGDVTNAKVTAFRMVEEAIERIIPHDPFEKGRSLSGPLSNVFRVKKGRIRIAYIASSKARRITILYISDTPRKQGDASDPYALLTQLVATGKFDRFFDVIGVRRHKTGGHAAPSRSKKPPWPA